MVANKIIAALALGMCLPSSMQAMEELEKHLVPCSSLLASKLLLHTTTPTLDNLTWHFVRELPTEHFTNWLHRRHETHPFTQDPTTITPKHTIPVRSLESHQKTLALCIQGSQEIVGTIEYPASKGTSVYARIFTLPCCQGTAIENILLKSALGAARLSGVNLSEKTTEKLIHQTLAGRTKFPIAVSVTSSKNKNVLCLSKPCAELLHLSEATMPTAFLGQCLAIIVSQKEQEPKNS